MRPLKLLVGVLIILISMAAQAANTDQNIEEHLKVIAIELRCMVCQNQTLADSNAELAIDLKNEIRKMLKNGLSDQEIIAFMVQRYGDFIRYRPPLKATTFFLWFGPLMVGLIALIVLIIQFQKHRKVIIPAALSDDAEQQIKALFKESEKQ